MAHNIKFKQGAASFYIVAIATLILVIMATSFAAIIMSEIARTSNDDLAQSAYDSALAGIEDAKLAYYEYNKCVAGKASPGTDCDSIKAAFTSGNCNSVATILGRLGEGESEVKIKESLTSTGESMDQAYTCVKFEPRTDVTGVLSGDGITKSTEVVRISTQGGEANKVASILVHWGEKTEDSTTLPPVLEFGIIQAGDEFNLDSFTMTQKISEDMKFTNRGTLFLEPKEVDEGQPITTIEKSALLKSNDKTSYNSPYQVNCNIAAASNGANGEYLCTANIELPSPVGGYRSDRNFMVVLSMMSSSEIPFNFSLCREGGCQLAAAGGTGGYTDNTVHMDLQLAVDSTGRANDLYRRVYTILNTSGESGDSTATIDALSAQNIKKIEYSTCEKVYGSDGAGCED